MFFMHSSMELPVTTQGHGVVNSSKDRRKTTVNLLQECENKPGNCF